MTSIVMGADKTAAPAKKPESPPRDRIRQDKFSTLHLPCFLSDLDKQGKS